jgi:hypothetical protein
MATTIGWRSTVTSSTPIGTNERNLPTKHIKHPKGVGDSSFGNFFRVYSCLPRHSPAEAGDSWAISFLLNCEPIRVHWLLKDF